MINVHSLAHDGMFFPVDHIAHDGIVAMGGTLAGRACPGIAAAVALGGVVAASAAVGGERATSSATGAVAAASSAVAGERETSSATAGIRKRECGT